MRCAKKIALSRPKPPHAASGCVEAGSIMAVLTIVSTVFISAVFVFDFAHTILDLKRDRAQLKAVKLKTKAGGFGV